MGPKSQRLLGARERGYDPTLPGGGALPPKVQTVSLASCCCRLPGAPRSCIIYINALPALLIDPSAQNVIAGVDVFNVAGQRGRRVAHQKSRHVANILDAHKLMLWCPGACAFQQFVEPLDA